MRPSRLYRNLGLNGPLLAVTAAAVDLGDHVYSIGIQRGGGDLSSHSPSTITVDTPTNLDPLNLQSVSSQALDVRLTDEAAEMIHTAANLPETTPLDYTWRFRGRAGRMSAKDSSTGRRGTTLIGAAWSSILPRLSADQHGWTPTEGANLRAAAGYLFAPPFEPRLETQWVPDSSAEADTWPPTDDGEPYDPISPGDLLGILTDRLHIITDARAGELRITTLNGSEIRSERAANAWPIARAQVVDDGSTTWEQPSAFSTVHVVDVRNPDDTIQIYTAGPSPQWHVIEAHDWTSHRAVTNQWERVKGLQWADSQTSWHLSSITIRVDILLASPSEYDRAVAGAVLRLNTGDAVGLAGDWPDHVTGVHFVTQLDERITADGWTIKVGLTPHRAMSGRPSIPVTPVAWNQTRNLNWADAERATWSAGLPPSV